eukprot:Amastigsp_a174521_437.p4 type:complete len:121 gc:universal Amastigsp_a174521_437:1150-788(-)
MSKRTRETTDVSRSIVSPRRCCERRDAPWVMKNAMSGLLRAHGSAAAATAARASALSSSQNSTTLGFSFKSPVYEPPRTSISFRGQGKPAAVGSSRMDDVASSRSTRCAPTSRSTSDGMP